MGLVFSYILVKLTFHNSMYFYSVKLCLQVSSNCMIMLQDLAVSSLSLVRRVHIGSSWLCLSTPQDQSV